jgi:multiple sugar transport system substrate-binding protein
MSNTSDPSPRIAGHPDSQVSRRGFLGGTLAVAAAGIGLSACASPVAAGLIGSKIDPGTVDYWNLFGGGDGIRMEAMEAGFEATHRDIGLQSVTLAWGNPYYTKLSLATLGAQPPNVAISHLTRMKTLVAANLLQELHPEDLARHGMSADKFNRRAWNTGLVDGRIYAIPLDTHPFVCFYNTQVCKKAGLLDAQGKLKPIQGEAEFLDALNRAKQASGQYGAVIAITNENATPWRIFQTLYSQLGGQVLADDGRRIVLDDAKATRALKLLASLNTKGLIPGSMDYQGSIALFAGGKAAFFFQGEWEITTFQTAKTPFGMAPFPNVLGGTYAVQADSHTLVLPKNPKQNRADLDRALTFVRSMLDQSGTWAKGGHVPAWLPYRNSADYAKLTPQSNYASTADFAVYDPQAWYSGSGSDFETIVGGTVGAVIAGQLQPAAGIAQIRSKLQVLARTDPPT